MTRTVEQVANNAVEAFYKAHTSHGFFASHKSDGYRTLAYSDLQEVAQLAAREAQAAPDFEPTGLVRDWYRDEWLNIAGEPGFKLRIKGQDPDFSHTASFTKWLTITPEQARRILAMLSMEEAL